MKTDSEQEVAEAAEQRGSDELTLMRGVRRLILPGADTEDCSF